MPKGFINTITLVAATATNLAAALVAAGYTGSMMGKFLEIDDLALTDLRRGDSASVSGSVGTLISGVNAGIFRREANGGTVDAHGIWLFSTAGGAITVSFWAL